MFECKEERQEARIEELEKRLERSQEEARNYLTRIREYEDRDRRKAIEQVIEKLEQAKDEGRRIEISGEHHMDGSEYTVEFFAPRGVEKEPSIYADGKLITKEKMLAARNQLRHYEQMDEYFSVRPKNRGIAKARYAAAKKMLDALGLLKEVER
jgi:hypothetical protein